MHSFDINEQYWREFAVKFARKRGVRNLDTLQDLEQDAMVKLYSIDLSRLKTQKEFERFTGRCIANMIRDWQSRERLRNHAQLFEFTSLLNTTDNIENYFCDYAESLIPQRVTFYDGSCALVDSTDYERINQHNWHIKDCGRKKYARAWINGHHVYLHHLIASIVPNPDRETVNFINNDTFDCRRRNLAIGVTPLIELL